MKALCRVFSAAAIVALCEPAFAECSLQDFDHTQPKALTGSVDLNGESFAFGSDVDHVDGRTIVWNYVENKSTSRSVSISWPKGQISLNIINPLAPGMLACKTYSVGANYTDDVDDEAVLKYGNASHEQSASVYIPRIKGDGLPDNVKTSLDVSYLDSLATKKVHVEFYFNMKDNKILSMGLSAPDGYSIGIGGATNFWSSNTTKSFSYLADKQKVNTSVSSWSSFAGGNNIKEFLAYAGVPDGQAIFSSGSFDGFGVGEKVSAISQTDIIVFDSDHRPILSSKILLPNTKEDQ